MSGTNGNGETPPASRFYQRRGTGGYYCEDCRNRVPHRICRPKGNPSARVPESPTTRKLPPKGYDFPRRNMPITPQEELFDPDRILAGRESCVTRRPTDQTILQQPRIETTKIIETSGFDPTVYRILDPLLEKLEHLYPRHDAEPFYRTSTVEVPPADPVDPLNRPGTATGLTIDTPVANDLFLKWVTLRPQDGLFPSQAGVSLTIDGNPVKAIASPVATVHPPVYGGQPFTRQFVDAVSIPDGFYNLNQVVAERKRVALILANFDPIPFRKMCVELWGWLQPMTDFAR